MMTGKFGDKWETIDDRPFAESGQSIVYKVRDTTQGEERIYALKRYVFPHKRVRATREVEALRKLDHKNIVKIVDFNLEPEDRKPWLVQEYFDGGNLELEIRNHPNISLSRAFDYLSQICEGLSFCHTNSVFHRDIKPANIFLDASKERVVIGDFGICWIPSDAPRVTATEEAMGPRFYMAPEYADGSVEEPTAKGDIYSLGKLIYFLFSGGEIFDREKHRNERWNIVFLEGKPTPSNPDRFYLEHLNLLMDKMILENPEDRCELSDVLSQVSLVRRLVMERFNLMEGEKYAPCKYCGQGSYQPIAASQGSFKDFLGLQRGAVSPRIQEFRAMVCDKCGNVQVFRFQNASDDWIGR